MVIIREYNTLTDGYSTNKSESYRLIRDKIKQYWKRNNGDVLSTKKVSTKNGTYCNYVVRITY